MEFLGTIDANKQVSDGAPVMDLEIMEPLTVL